MATAGPGRVQIEADCSVRSTCWKRAARLVGAAWGSQVMS